tara:strand:- start:11 stop:328 length:318 start_codon:yes stop_codon:yes gene_type:complete
MKNYKTLKRSRVIAKLDEFVARHNKFKNCFFWSPISPASRRRQLEEANELEFEFVLNGDRYRFSQHVRVSCKNTYYYAIIEKNGDSRDIRLAKKLIKLYAPQPTT